MTYLLEVRIDGYTSLITDCYDNSNSDALWDMYEDICSVEEAGGTRDDFDVVLSDHGCTPGGAGIMYNCERQGFYIEQRPDGSKFVNINGIEHEVVNTTYVPSITTSLAPSGFWSGW